MSRLLRLLPLALLTIAVACAQPARAPVVDSSADVNAIANLRNAYAAAANAGELNALMALYADDAIVMPNGQMAVTGKAAVTAFQKGMMDQFTQSLTLTSEETKVMGDTAYDRGQYTYVLTPKAMPDPNATPMPGMPTGPVTEQGKYLVILAKQTDGAWKLTREIGNPNSMMPAPAAGQ